MRYEFTKAKRAPHMAARNWVAAAIASDTDQCLLWPYATLRNGYGQFNTGTTSARVHRYVCIAVHGEPPGVGMEAAHSCGNRACANPKHLRWATPKENHADQVTHGTINRGQRNGHAKLTPSIVRACRASSMTRTELARIFGVSVTTISHAIIGKTWSWLDEA